MHTVSALFSVYGLGAEFFEFGHVQVFGVVVEVPKYNSK